MFNTAKPAQTIASAPLKIHALNVFQAIPCSMAPVCNAHNPQESMELVLDAAPGLMELFSPVLIARL